jgi:hypothetical protein
MPKLIKLFVFLGLLILAFPAAAQAHTLAKDGRISAFLHIAPDDKPLPGRINTVHFYFNDQDFRFSMEGCDCSVKVNQDKKVLYKGILPAEAPRVGKINVFLPDNNFSYGVVVSGTPKTAGFFQPFTLKFDIDVGNPPPEPSPVSHWKLAWTMVAIAAVALSAVLYRPLRRYIIKR